MRDIWEAFKELIEANDISRDTWWSDPESISAFNEPASDEDFERIEEATNLDLPDQLVDLYRIHDGGAAPLLPYGARFLSCEEIVETWRSLAELADEFNADLPPEPVSDGTHLFCAYHRERLPFAVRYGDYTFVDFAPGPEGSPGQILHPLGEGTYQVSGTDLRDYLTRWIELIREGDVRWSDDLGYFSSSDENTTVDDDLAA